MKVNGYDRKRETSCLSIRKGLVVTILLRKQKGKPPKCPVGGIGSDHTG